MPSSTKGVFSHRGRLNVPSQQFMRCLIGVPTKFISSVQPASRQTGLPSAGRAKCRACQKPNDRRSTPHGRFSSYGRNSDKNAADATTTCWMKRHLNGRQDVGRSDFCRSIKTKIPQLRWAIYFRQGGDELNTVLENRCSSPNHAPWLRVAERRPSAREPSCVTGSISTDRTGRSFQNFLFRITESFT